MKGTTSTATLAIRQLRAEAAKARLDAPRAPEPAYKPFHVYDLSECTDRVIAVEERAAVLV